jgi:hypothetical protein
MTFWGELVLTSICIKSPYFSLVFEPADLVAVHESWLWYLDL